MRIWFKIYDNTRILSQLTVDNYENDTRTHKIFAALEEACVKMDLGKPIWLDKNVAEFQKHRKTRFHQDNFVEEIEFDYLEMEIIEED